MYKRVNKKPTFIKVIWALLCLAELAFIAFRILSVRLNKLLNDSERRLTDLWPYYIFTLTIFKALVSLAHWIFAT